MVFSVEIEVPLKHLNQDFLSGKNHRSITFKEGRCQVSSHSQFPIKHALRLGREVSTLHYHLLWDISCRHFTREHGVYLWQNHVF